MAVRIRLSNLLGTRPLTITDARIARSDGQSAAAMIGLYARVVRRIHARHLTAILATISPFGSYRYWTPDVEQRRKAINAWMHTSGKPDGVIDQETPVADPADPMLLNAAFDSGDGLHPNDAGHAALGNAIPLSLFPTP